MTHALNFGMGRGMVAIMGSIFPCYCNTSDGSDHHHPCLILGEQVLDHTAAPMYTSSYQAALLLLPVLAVVSHT
jgi:hypothetical protein